MVVDPGGGTLDWYLTERTTPYWERSGAYPKAMLACAYAVADRLDSGWRDQAAIVDRIDCAIREQLPSFKVQGEEIAMAEHRPAVVARELRPGAPARPESHDSARKPVE